MTLSSGAEVLLPGTEAAEVADTTIEAFMPLSLSYTPALKLPIMIHKRPMHTAAAPEA
jgi:hypothetical protein